MNKQMPINKESFANYVNGKKWLILDNTSVGKSSLRLMLRDLGITLDKISMATDLDEAILKVKQEQPHFIFAPDEIDEKPGLKLLEIHKKLYPNRLSTFFCMISDDNSLAGSARLAEKGVDLLLVRPYTTEVLNQQFVNSISPKVNPSVYIKQLETGKGDILVENYQDALKHFESAIIADPLLPAPYYFIGKINYEKGDFQVSEEYFKKGLERDSKNYRCLNGLFELYYKMNKFKEAYEQFEKLIKYYPVNPKRLPDYIRVCVAIKRYDDIIGFCDLFSRSDLTHEIGEDRKIRKHLVAGLVVAGEYLFGIKEEEKAINALKSAVTYCRGTMTVIKKIVMVLIENNKHVVAQELLDKLSNKGAISSDDKHLIDFDIAFKIYPIEKTLELGLNLIKDGVKDFHVYDVVINKSLEINRNSDIVKEIIFDAIKLYPEKTDYFRQKLPL